MEDYCLQEVLPLTTGVELVRRKDAADFKVWCSCKFCHEFLLGLRALKERGLHGTKVRPLAALAILK